MAVVVGCRYCAFITSGSFMPSPRLLCLSLLLLSLAPLAQAQDSDPVLPYRPSVASPAQLPVPGQLEFEAGGLLSKTDGTPRQPAIYLQTGVHARMGRAARGRGCCARPR